MPVINYSKLQVMRVCWIVLLLAGFIPLANCQKTITTASVQLSFPQGEYKATYPKTGVGVRWSILHRFHEDDAISIGGELGYLSTGSTSRVFDIYYAGYYDRYRISATNNILSLAFKARADLLPLRQSVRLFLDGTIGTNLFFSSINVSQESYFGNSQYGNGNSSKGYWSLIFGPGLGIEIPLGVRKEIALCFKGSYLFGTNTKYLTDPYIDIDGNVYFTQRESKTSMIISEAGVRFKLF
jgi:outer membrane receptor protein involved in Fe transport